MACGDHFELDGPDEIISWVCVLDEGHDGNHETAIGQYWSRSITMDLDTGIVTVE